jgi:hypothetical protein
VPVYLATWELKQKDHLSPEGQGQLGLHSKTPSLILNFRFQSIS